ncbi:MAG: menaquinone biosynthesis protein [Chitinophagaceae bacterium]|nr:menaquinone biosynthesis protein [Chitinophagaceae bacterium]
MNLHATANDTRKIKVGAVSYLNTKPLIYGFEKGMMQDELDLLIDYPSKIAQSLLDNTIDIGLVPVAIIPEMEQHYIIGDYCIAADGEVASVCLFSQVPLQEITKVLLDYESRTSVMLVQYLIKEYWKIHPVFQNTGTDFINEIKGSTAAVVIGDRALLQRKVFPYVYDLAAAWKAHTGLPFVFAAWVSNKPMPEQFIADFNKANEYGFEHLDEVLKANPFDAFDLEQYYTHFIQYRLDDSKRKGLQLFLNWCSQIISVPAS